MTNALVDELMATAREDYDHVQKMLDDLRGRLMAAIVDVIEESGQGSPQHLRLRYALSGEGEGAPSERAVAVVAEHHEEVRNGPTEGDQPMSDAAKTVVLPHYGRDAFDLAKLNEALDAVVSKQTEDAGRYYLVHTLKWEAGEAVAYARAAQFCCDNMIDPNVLGA